MPKESNEEYHEIKNELINKLIFILGIVVIPAVFSSLIRFFQIGWQKVFLTHIFMIPALIILAIYRKKLSLFIKTIFLMSICLLLSILGLIDFGLGSFGIQFLMLCLLLAVVFLEKKIAIWTYVICITIIAVIGVLFVEGIVAANLNAYNTYISVWVSAFIAFSVVLGLVVFLVGSINQTLNSKLIDLKRMYKNLQKAKDEIKTLRGIIPICSFCKKIRDDRGYWNQIEAYIQDHSEASFSHGLCKDCAKRHYPEMDISDDCDVSMH